MPTVRPVRRRSKRISCFLSLLVLFALPLAAEETNDELLLMAVRIEQEILADAMSAYPRDGSVLLPLGELCRLVQFGIAVDLATQSAEGFFINETRRFRLDAIALQVEIEGVAYAIPRRKLLVLDDDLYVDAKLLGAWFPFDLQVDLFGSMVSLKPREKLPFQLQRERERAIERALSGLRGDDVPPFVPNPYALVSEPFVDQQLRLRHNGERAAMQYATLATGDLLGCEASFFLTGTNAEPIAELRGTLGRRDPTARLLGPLHAREVAIGDVVLPGNDLVTATSRGNGAVIASFPLQRAFAFDEQTLTGELAPGWEVELYLNGALIGFQRRDDGRYEFRDVPVLYGHNVFRLVFHGPRGERRQKIETYNIGETLTPRGELQYRVGSASPVAQPGRAVAEMAYGVTQRLSLAASATSLEGERYATAGLRASFGRLFAYSDAGGSASGGRIGRAGIQTRIAGVAITLTRAQLTNEYVSETYPSLLGLIASRTTVRLGGAIAAHTRYPLPVSIDVQRDELADGGSVVRATSLISTSVRQTWISNRVEGLLVRDVASPLAGDDNVTGALLVSRSLHGVILRGELGYELLPRRRPTVVSLLAELPRFRRFQLSGELSHSAASGISRAIARVRRDHGRIGVTVAVEVPSRGTPSLQLELVTSLIPNPLTRRIALRARPAASSGAVTARVFLDRNGNGARDDGEPPIEHAGFFVNRNSVAPRTNAGGIAMLDYLPVHAATDVRLSTSTLEDPWWTPSRPAVRMVPRPGKALVIDFPIAVAGEITGTITLKGRSAGRVRMQVVGDAGKVVAEAMSEYDGFYDITKIPPGTYTLRVHPEDVAAMSLAGDAARKVTITVEENVLDGIDFELQRSIRN